VLGRAGIPDMNYENPDGSSITMDIDYFGNARNTTNPAPGPFEGFIEGKRLLKVWPRR
jgi:alpha-N-arabinofuranosidase